MTESSAAVPAVESSPAAGVIPSAATATAVPGGRQLDRSIVEGPIAPAVWKIAWPTVLQNAIGGLQGIIDHADLRRGAPGSGGFGCPERWRSACGRGARAKRVGPQRVGVGPHAH